MRLYKIAEKDIIVTIESPDVTTKEGNRSIAIKKISGRFSNYPLKVVFENIGDEIIIITAYPLKKKHWR